ncbi:MAG: Zn-ribbon domain-containing OB-fold protein [Acidimicrobiales bacterium]
MARFDLPTPDEYTSTWWEAAVEGRLLLVRCAQCGRAHHYPRPFCPRCGSDDVSWETASGSATLYTWSVVHRNDLPPFNEHVPYVAAIVELAEGPRMMTNVVDCELDALEVGMGLQVEFRGIGEGYSIPVFHPAA